MPLKSMEIKAFFPCDKLYRKPDGQGMYLEVRPNGSKLWFLKYRMDGKEKRLGLGSYPDVSLADARTAREKARTAIQAGRDPLHDRKMTKNERRIGAGHTFKSVADDFIQTKLVASRKAQGGYRTYHLRLNLPILMQLSNQEQPVKRPKIFGGTTCCYGGAASNPKLLGFANGRGI